MLCYALSMTSDPKRVTTMNVSLSEALRAFVDGRVSEAGFSSVSEYVRELIRQDQREAARAALEARLLAALETPSTEMSDEDWADLKAQVLGTGSKSETE